MLRARGPFSRTSILSRVAGGFENKWSNKMIDVISRRGEKILLGVFSFLLFAIVVIFIFNDSNRAYTGLAGILFVTNINIINSRMIVKRHMTELMARAQQVETSAGER